LAKDCIVGRKGKGYATEVVTIAEKLLPEMVSKDDSDNAQSQQDRTKRLEAEDNPKKVLKPEEDQRYTSVLPPAGAKKQPQKPRDTPKRVKQGRPRKGRKAATKDVLEEHWARGYGLLEAAVYTHKEGSLKIGLWIGRLVNTESLNRLRMQPQLDDCTGTEL
jgi:hypothetical protein